MIRLSPTQRIIAWRLALQGSATIGELLHAVYGNDPDGGPDTAPSVLKNRVCFLRETLHPHGIGIIGVRFFAPSHEKRPLEPTGCQRPVLAEIAARSDRNDVLANEIARNVPSQITLKKAA